MLRLEGFLSMPHWSAANEVIEKRTVEEAAMVTQGEGRTIRASWRGARSAAANAHKVLSCTRGFFGGAGGIIRWRSICQGRDLWIPSGLTIMVGIQRWAWQKGTKLVFKGAQEPGA